MCPCEHPPMSDTDSFPEGAGIPKPNHVSVEGFALSYDLTRKGRVLDFEYATVHPYDVGSMVSHHNLGPASWKSLFPFEVPCGLTFAPRVAVLGRLVRPVVDDVLAALGNDSCSALRARRASRRGCSHPSSFFVSGVEHYLRSPLTSRLHGTSETRLTRKGRLVSIGVKVHDVQSFRVSGPIVPHRPWMCQALCQSAASIGLPIRILFLFFLLMIARIAPAQTGPAWPYVDRLSRLN